MPDYIQLQYRAAAKWAHVGMSVRSSLRPQPVVYSVTLDLCVCALIGCWEGSGREEGPV